MYKNKNIVNLVKKYMEDLENKYKNVSEIIKIGECVLGEDLLVYKIGNGDKKIFINAEHHPREYITTILTLHQMYYLLDANEKSLIIDGINIRDLLSKVTFYFQPMVNPDGLNICVNGEPSRYTNANDVEINNNYDAMVDEDDDYSSLTGEYPFSQPETKAIKDLGVSKLKKPSFTIEVGKGAIIKPVPFEEYETIVIQNIRVPIYMGEVVSNKEKY